MTENPLVHDAIEHLQAAGIHDFILVHDQYDEESFGDAEAVFRVGVLMLRFLRDRGQDLVEVGSASWSGTYYAIADVDVVMGWRSATDTAPRPEPEQVRSIVSRLATNRHLLEHAFSEARETTTRENLEAAKKRRADAFMAHLQRLAHRD